MLPVVAGVAERLTLKGGKNDFLGVGVGVGLGAACSDSAKPRSNTDFSQKILPVMIQLRVPSKPWSFHATVKDCTEKIVTESLFIR